MASFSILTGILSAPGDLELFRAFIARSTYSTFTGCSLNLVSPKREGSTVLAMVMNQGLGQLHVVFPRVPILTPFSS